MTPSFCGHCGAALVAGVSFCGSCGHPVATPDPAPPPATFSQPPVPPGRGRRLAAIGSVLALLVLAAGAGTAFVLVGGDQPAGGDRAAGPAGAVETRAAAIDNGLSILEGPGSHWVFDADEVLPGSTVGGVLYFPDAVVARLGLDDASALVGLDPADGELLWQRDESEVGWWCETVATGTVLLCAAAGDAGILRLDPRSGEEVLEYPVDRPRWVSSVGGTVYVGSQLGGRWSYDVRVTALDLDGFGVEWTRDLVADGGSEDWASVPVQAAGSDLVLQTGPTLWRLARDGTVLAREAADDFDEWLDGEYRLTSDGLTTTVRDWSGLTVATLPGSTWASYADGGQFASGPAVVDGRIGAGYALYDLTTGEEVWAAPHLSDYDPGQASWEWSPGGEFVLAHDVWDPDGDAGGTTLLDGDTGEELWRSERPVAGYNSAFTDDAVAAVDGEAWDVRVHRLDGDGETTWSESVAEVVEDREGYGSVSLDVGVSGPALVVAGDVGLLGFTGFGAADVVEAGADGDSDSDDGTAYTTACGSPPEFVPVASEPANGGITITYEVHAVCPGGQWLNLTQLQVPFVVDGYTYADAYFDFGLNPYWIPEEGQTLQLVYPYAQTTVPADEIAEAITRDGGSGDVVLVECEPGPGNSEAPVPSQPEYGGDPEQPNQAVGAPDDDGGVEERDESALEALRRIAAEDEAAVAALDWTAQLSSKKPGTYDDGMVYDSFDDILALHLRLRAQYPDSLLVLSTDWPGTYSRKSRGYWVTLSGGSDPTTAPVLRWCRNEGRGEGDCWAVRVRRSGDPARNADHAPPDERNN